MTLTVPVCAACGRAAFPPRALCPHCACADWTSAEAEGGTIEQVTVRDGVAIAAVRLELGPVVIARARESMRPGETVSLAVAGGAPEASPAA